MVFCAQLQSQICKLEAQRQCGLAGGENTVSTRTPKHFRWHTITCDFIGVFQ